MPTDFEADASGMSAAETPVPSQSASQMRTRTYSIGHVARMLSVSAQTLRYYEKEGMIIPIRTSGGTRRFTRSDVRRLQRVRDLIVEDGLNVAGIRVMLGMIPCWELRGCDFTQASQCPQLGDDTGPCWINQDCLYKTGDQTCRECPVYVRAFDVLSDRRVLRLLPDGWPGR